MLRKRICLIGPRGPQIESNAEPLEFGDCEQIVEEKIKKIKRKN